MFRRRSISVRALRRAEAIEKTRNYLTKQLELSGWKVTRQTFTDTTPRGKSRVCESHRHLSADRIACSFVSGLLALRHQDFRYGADSSARTTGLEHGRTARTGPGSGAAPGSGAKAELVFFDGEEAYEAFSETDGLYGSRYFARQTWPPRTRRNNFAAASCSTWWAIDR